MSAHYGKTEIGRKVIHALTKSPKDALIVEIYETDTDIARLPDQHPQRMGVRHMDGGTASHAGGTETSGR